VRGFADIKKFENIAKPFVDSVAGDKTQYPFFRAFMLSPFSRKYAREIRKDERLLDQISSSDIYVSRAMRKLYFAAHNIEYASKSGKLGGNDLVKEISAAASEFMEVRRDEGARVRLDTHIVSETKKYYVSKPLLGLLARAMLGCSFSGIYPETQILVAQTDDRLSITLSKGIIGRPDFKLFLQEAFMKGVCAVNQGEIAILDGKIKMTIPEYG